MFQSVPNQKAIVGWHRIPANKDNPYTTVNTESFRMASRNLTAKAFTLWCAFCTESNATDNPDKQLHVYHLSPQAIVTQWGIPRASYYRAIDELVEKNYLIPYNTNYIFYERPKE